MTPPNFKGVAAFLIVATAAIFALAAWHQRGMDLARAEEQIAAQKTIAKGLEDQARALEQREQSRAAQTAQQLESMRALVAKIKTPEQIVNWIPAQPGFEGLHFELPAESPRRDPSTAPPGGSAQDDSATAVIAAEDLPKLRDSISECEICKVARASAEADAASKAERLRLAGEQLAAVASQRDAALRAAKGGGFLTRVKRNAKWFAVGAAAAWAFTYAHERAAH